MNGLSEMPNRMRGAYLCFSLALFIALGSYQFISPVKQAVFFDLVGTGPEPLAKSLVLLILVPALMVYGALFTCLQDPKWLMLVVGGFYCVMYLLVGIVYVGANGQPGAWLAWFLYFLTETRAVILMPMIWSIVNDVTDSELAKATYPYIFCVIQVGGIAGSFVAVHVSSLGGIFGLLVFQAALIVLIILLTWAGCVLLEADGQDDLERVPLVTGQQFSPTDGGGGGDSRQGKEADKHISFSAIEGLWLLLSRPYAFMTFWVSYATLMPRTVLDYTNGVKVHEVYPDKTQQVAFWGHMSLVQNSVTAVLTLLGTKWIVTRLGVGKTLLVLPCVLLASVLAICIHNGLWVTVVACVTASVVAYGLNSPCKEMLYIRTSRNIKYKAKSWSEMYGNELMKLLGAQINLWVNNDDGKCSPDCFHEVPTLVIVVLWVALWLATAWRVGSEHEHLEKEDKIVE